MPGLHAGRRSPTSSGSGGAATKTVQSALRRPHDVYGEQNAGQWKAHGRYIARESAGGTVLGPLMTSDVDGRRDLPVEPAKELARWQSEGDPRLWKLIVSPEFGERRRS